MRAVLAAMVVSGTMAGCTSAPPPAAAVNDGYVHVLPVRGQPDLACDGRPLALDGDHADIRLAGDCRRLRVTGDHNDVTVLLPPGAVVEVTGSHNDIFWRQSRPGPKPELLDRGAAGSNTFHYRPDAP